MEEIASITKIHLHSLELLEASQWEHLPPEPFIRGFIIAYAKYVGLEPKEVLERYYEETGRRKSTLQPHTESRAPEAYGAATAPGQTPSDVIAAVQFPNSTRIVFGAALAVVIGIIAILISVGKHAEPASENLTLGTGNVKAGHLADALPRVSTDPAINTVRGETARGTESAHGGPDSRSVALASVAPLETAKPGESFAHQITVEGKERTWVKVVIDDKAPLEYFLDEGQKASYSAKNKIKVVLGNATGSRVLYNGKPIEGTKFNGTIRTYRFPSHAKFPQDSPSRHETSSTADATEPNDGVSPE